MLEFLTKHWNINIRCNYFHILNNKSADLTVDAQAALVYSFVVRMQQSQVFSRRCSLIIAVLYGLRNMHRGMKLNLTKLHKLKCIILFS